MSEVHHGRVVYPGVVGEAMYRVVYTRLCTGWCIPGYIPRVYYAHGCTYGCTMPTGVPTGVYMPQGVPQGVYMPQGVPQVCTMRVSLRWVPCGYPSGVSHMVYLSGVSLRGYASRVVNTVIPGLGEV